MPIVPKLLDIPKHSKRWKSYLAFQDNKVKNAYEPRNTKQVRRIVDFAIQKKRRVRVVGSGHSFSNILQGDDILLVPYRLASVKVLDAKARRGRISSRFYNGLGKRFRGLGDRFELAEVGAGTTIREMNRKLARKKLGLLNQGTYDGQRIWGAVATSTHGSGITLPPFPDMVVSVLMVVDRKRGAQTVRVEPKDGPTRKDHREKGVDELIQDDDTFYSVICGMGCLGIATSVIVAVRDLYYLHEIGELTTWKALRSSLNSARKVRAFNDETDKGRSWRRGKPRTWRHTELLVSPNPSPKKILGKALDADLVGENLVSVVRRADGVPHTRAGKVPIPLMLSEAKSPNVRRIDRVARLDIVPYSITNSSAAVALPFKKGQRSYSYRNVYYYVFPRGGKKAGGLGFELAAPAGKAAEVIDALIEKMDAMTSARSHVFFGPIGVRFVHASDAYLSPQFDRETVMFEVTINHKKKWQKAQVSAMKGLQTHMLKRYSYLRIHWGLELDLIRGAHVERHYRKLKAWKATKRQFSAHGTFNNAFTRRIGV